MEQLPMVTDIIGQKMVPTLLPQRTGYSTHHTDHSREQGVRVLHCKQEHLARDIGHRVEQWEAQLMPCPK